MLSRTRRRSSSLTNRPFLLASCSSRRWLIRSSRIAPRASGVSSSLGSSWPPSWVRSFSCCSRSACWNCGWVIL